MPPAKSPPSWGALASPPVSCPPPLPVSLLLRALPVLLGAFSMPGTGGAPPGIAGPLLSFLLSMIGADLSFTTATFFKRAPLEISPSNASCRYPLVLLGGRNLRLACTYPTSWEIFLAWPSRKVAAGRWWRRRRRPSKARHRRRRRRRRSRHDGVKDRT